jgi:hypothetical protein
MPCHVSRSDMHAGKRPQAAITNAFTRCVAVTSSRYYWDSERPGNLTSNKLPLW